MSDEVTNLVNIMLTQAFGRQKVSSCRYQILVILLSRTTTGTDTGYRHVTYTHYTLRWEQSHLHLISKY